MFWLNVFLILIIVLGHVALTVVALNRIYAFPLVTSLLSLARMAHDIWMVGGALAIVWFLGFHNPKALISGYGAGIPYAIIGYVILCMMVAVIGIPAEWIRRLIRTTPVHVKSRASFTLDVADKLGSLPIGKGPYQRLVRAPFNQAFQVEFVELELILPRCPPVCDGLSILHLSDLHFIGTITPSYFKEVVHHACQSEVDLVVITGDLVDDSCYIDWLPDILSPIQATVGRYYILGNHDKPHDISTIRNTMKEIGFVGIAGRSEEVRFNGYSIILSGTERPWIGQHPDIKDISDNLHILLSHTPDYFLWAKRNGVDLVLSGHLHGGQVTLPGWGTVYSPSWYGGRYASGAYWAEPSLMYVNRGLSGVHPIRFGSRPEVTRLVIRSSE
jgi:predicted MPP superfamily phosphohydrolase